jgi:hypothetical protein
LSSATSIFLVIVIPVNALADFGQDGSFVLFVRLGHGK